MIRIKTNELKLRPRKRHFLSKMLLKKCEKFVGGFENVLAIKMCWGSQNNEMKSMKSIATATCFQYPAVKGNT